MITREQFEAIVDEFCAEADVVGETEKEMVTERLGELIEPESVVSLENMAYGVAMEQAWDPSEVLKLGIELGRRFATVEEAIEIVNDGAGEFDAAAMV